VGYLQSSDTLYVTNAGDGSLRLFRGADFSQAGRIELGGDADNVRVDDAGQHVFVGYGEGALAVIDTASNRKVTDLALMLSSRSNIGAVSLNLMCPRVPR